MRLARFAVHVAGVLILAGNSAHADPVVPSLIAYWDCNQTDGTVLPAVVGGYGGTLAGTWPDDGSQWVHSTLGLGNALNFQGGWVDMGELPQSNPMNVSGNLAIAAWIKPDSLGGGNAGRILNHRSTSTDTGYEVYLRETGQVAFHYGPSLFTSSTADAVEIGPDASWQQVVVTLSEVYQVQAGAHWVDRTRVTFYVNGEARGSEEIAPPVPVPGKPTLLLGDSTAHGATAPGDRGFDGQMDEIAVWSTPLAVPHVRALFSLADHADIRHDLGQVQTLFDMYDAGVGGSVRHGSLQWDYATGLRAGGAELGEVFKSDGRYVVMLDNEGTGFLANAELIGHWRFDEPSGATAYDSAGTNEGTLHGIDDNLPTRIEGKFGSALSFDGQYAQQVEVGADNVITALDGAKTFSFWTRLQYNEPSSNGFLGIDNDTSENRWYIDDHNSGGDLRVSQDGGGTSEELFIIDNVLNYDSPQWQHVLLADDGTGPGGTRVYVDGQLVATVDSFDYSGLLPGSALRFGVARHMDGYRWLKGDLDDVGVWRVALTDPQAKALYNAGQHAELGYDLGRVQQLFNAHYDGGGTRVDGRYWVHAAGLNADTEALGQVVQDGQKFYLPLAEDGTGVWAPGKLIAHWTFDDGDGTEVADAMGNVHGTLQGTGGTGAWISDGRVGGALRLDSSRGQYVLAGSDNVVTSLPGEKTIAFWVRLEENGVTDRSNGFVSIDRDGGNRWYLDTGTGTDTNDIRAYRADGGSGADVFRVSGVLEYDQWQHVVITDDGTGSGGVRVFVNGEIAGTRDSFEFFDLLRTTTLRLGAARHGGALQYLHGDLDDFGIWSTALTESQVAGLYQFAADPDLGYNLGMMQQLFDHHERGPGGGELVLGDGRGWQYTDGLDTGLGLLVWKDGHYCFQLDHTGTGLMTIPEPGSLALLAFGLIAISSARRRGRSACRAVCLPG